MSGMVSRLRALGRADRVLLALLGLHVVLKVLMYVHAAGADIFGDESAYANGARSFSNALRDLGSFGPVDGAELERNVVGSGWFMPGMSLLLTPLFLVVPDASTEIFRAYLGVVSTAMFAYALWEVRRVLGRRVAVAFAVLPGLIPTFALFGVAAWGDAYAGLALVVVLVRAVEMARQVAGGVAPSRRQAAALAGWSIATVYLRSSVLPIIAAIGVLALVGVVVGLRDHERRRGLVAGVVGGAVFLAVLLPWSVAASASLGGRVVTTTSVPLALANTFGDREQFCYGPCDPGSTIWFNPLRYSREVARATGHSEMEVQQQMSAYARRDMTAHSYATNVVDDFDRYTTEPWRFLTYLPLDGETDPVEDGARIGTEWLFQLATGIAVLALLLVARRSRERQVQLVLVKLALGGLLFQPFVHVAGPRYWTTAAAVAGLALGLLATWALDLRAVRRGSAAPPDGLRSLTILQAALSVAAVAGLGTVLLLA